MKTVIINGKIITEEGGLPRGHIILDQGKIQGIFPGEYLPLGTETIFDAGGRYISPGFIDLHVHGGGGDDFMCGQVDKVENICKLHMKHGTTAIVPTLSSADQKPFMEAIKAIEQAIKIQEGGPEILGIHLEGPYFAMSQKGAQDPRFVRNPDPAEYLDVVSKFDTILRWSVAPELPGAHAMAKVMKQHGIRMAIGHSDALYEEAIEAFENGFDTVTHLYSGCSTVRRIDAYRYAGVIEAAYQMDDMMVEVIADGKHLPESLLKLIYKIKGPQRICLVTDAISAAGLPEDVGVIYSPTCGTDVLIEDSVAKLPDRSAFAGSIATTDRLVRVMSSIAEIPLHEAVNMMSATPAKNIGVFDRKGSLAPGKDADIILFDENIHVSLVLVKGQIRYQEQK